MIEAALRLGHEEILEGKAFQSYMRSAAAENYSFEHMFDRSRRLESRYELLIEILDEGMIGVNEHGEVIACNQKAADITGKTPEQAIGRPAEIVFPYIPFEVCLRYQKKELPRLIRIGSANINLSVVPVIRAGECLGAFASLQRFNELENVRMSFGDSCCGRDIWQSIILRMWWGNPKQLSRPEKYSEKWPMQNRRFFSLAKRVREKSFLPMQFIWLPEEEMALLLLLT